MNNVTTLRIDSTTQQTGRVKWYDVSRGFGFVVVPGVEKDFLLHKNVLIGLGLTSIAEGSQIEFEYLPTSSGFRITSIIAAQPADENEDKDATPEPDQLLDGTFPARVKWFDPKKGYGFVNAFGSLEDIFVGVGVLRKAMLSSLDAGQAVSIEIAITNDRKSVYRIHDWC